jgi:HTH-type transcriptional regulator/antitoxin MqsA
MINHEVLERALAGSRARRGLPSPERRRLIRIAAGLTQSELAEAVGGVDPSTVVRWESGANQPTREHAAAYLEVLEQLASETGIALTIADSVEAAGDGRAC